MNIDELLKSINKDGKIVTAAKDAGIKEWVSTGMFAMDDALGGGIPTGGPVFFEGKPSSGKSAFAYYMAGRMIKKNKGKALIIQSEAGFDKKWAAKCGLPLKDTAICDSVKDLGLALDFVLKTFTESDDINCLIFDSLSGLGDTSTTVSDSHSRGERAIPQNRFFRKLANAINQPIDPLLMFMEHLHPNVASSYGGQTTSGGETKKYMSILTIRFQKQYTGSTVVVFDPKASKEEEIVEMLVGWDVQKNKGGPAGSKGTFNLGLRDSEVSVAGRIDNYRGLFTEALLRKIVTKAGSWYKFGDEKFHGEANFKKGVTADTLEKLIIEARKGVREAGSEGDGGKDDPE
jgi:RecA/RadA recombinase